MKMANYNYSLIDQVRFGSHFPYGNLKIKFRARTRQPVYGYAGCGYGDVNGYGDGNCDDLWGYRIKVFQTQNDGSLLEIFTQDIEILDHTRPDFDRYIDLKLVSHNLTFLCLSN
jgi:hypothetical protein